MGKTIPEVLRDLGRAARLRSVLALTDAQLLEQFALRRDEASFEALLHRHGPLVFGVCRRLLYDAHDAEDAFQATFLVLARKASSIHRRALLGSGTEMATKEGSKSRLLVLKRMAKDKKPGAVTSLASRTHTPAGGFVPPPASSFRKGSCPACRLSLPKKANPGVGV